MSYERLVESVAKAIGQTFGSPELDWTDEAEAAIAAYRAEVYMETE